MTTVFWVAVLVPVLGLASSIAVERMIVPRVQLRRHWATWALHAGVWLVPYLILLLLLGRPVYSAVSVAAIQLTVVLVNNAKYRSLREPFVFQDYEYFTDAIRHPRLYIPFMGWGKFLAATAGFVLAVSIGLWGEPVPEARFEWAAQGGALLALACVAVVLLMLGHEYAPDAVFDPESDMVRLGMVASMWRYAQHGRKVPVAESPFHEVRGAVQGGSAETSLSPDVVSRGADLPHMVSVQSESFFDARSLWDGVRTDVLANFDALRREAQIHGRLSVPAWGANTVRTEFAFLSGVDTYELGVHRFNPYRAVAAGMQVASLASYLKGRGYRTVCVHPYPANFYLRDRVFPALGFDEFIDIRSFDGTDRYGPYISDLAVARRVASLLQAAQEPTFVHVITMENHGPLHLERVKQGDLERLYHLPPPAGCDDLTIYLRHLRNADEMLGALKETLVASGRPASLCWFGDHVPIMPKVYDTFGTPDGNVEYAVWRNWGTEGRSNGVGRSSRDDRGSTIILHFAGTRASIKRNLAAHQLGRTWLEVAGV